MGLFGRKKKHDPPAPMSTEASAAPAIADDMRALDPIAYIRAVGLAPEDCYGFLPIDLHAGSSFFFLYRDRPQYARARAGLPEAGRASNLDLGAFEVDFGSSRQSDSLRSQSGLGSGDAVAQAMRLQEAWSDAATSGDPAVTMREQLRIAKEMGLVDDTQYQMMVKHMESEAGKAMVDEAAAAQAEAMAQVHEVTAPAQAATPPPGPAAAAAANAPAIVADRLYPGLYRRVSTQQLNTYVGPYRDALGLCPEDVYGVFPRETRRSSSSEDNSLEWDDYWIVYRDRPEYAQGRAAWATAMHPKDAKPLGGMLGSKLTGFIAGQVGDWPEAQLFEGVAGPGAARCGAEPVAVQKDRWPREKVVMRKRGPELGDALRAKIGDWGFAPEDSFGFCPDYGNGSIYFAWRQR